MVTSAGDAGDDSASVTAPLLASDSGSCGNRRQHGRRPVLGRVSARRGVGSAAAETEPEELFSFTLLDHARHAATLLLVLLAPLLACTARAVLRISGRLPPSGAAAGDDASAKQLRSSTSSSSSWRRAAEALPRAIYARAFGLQPAAAASLASADALGGGNSGASASPSPGADGADKTLPPRPRGVPPPLRSGFETIPLTGAAELSPPGSVLRMYYELHGPPGTSGAFCVLLATHASPNPNSQSPPKTLRLQPTTSQAASHRGTRWF